MVAVPAGLATSLAVVLGCRAPTQASIEITLSGLGCGDLHGVLLVAGPNAVGVDERLRAGLSTTRTERCDGNSVGTIVVTPTGPEGAIAVVAGLDRDVANCAASGFDGCIVARRAFEFRTSTTLRIPVVLEAACKGIACSADETCRAGACVSNRVSCIDSQCDVAIPTPTSPASPASPAPQVGPPSTDCRWDAPFDPPTPIELPTVPPTTLNDGGPLTGFDGASGATLSDDELSIVYASGGRIVEARREPGGPFKGAVILLDATGEMPLTRPTLTRDRRRLYYAKRIALTNFDIELVSAGSDGGFTDPQPIAQSGDIEFTPFVSADGTSLWYAHQGSAAEGIESYLRHAVLASNGKILSEDDLLPHDLNQNGAKARVFPVVSEDERTVYFGRFGALARSHRSTDWEPIEDVPLDFANPPYSVFPNWLSRDNCRLYLTVVADAANATPFKIFVATRTPRVSDAGM